MSPETAPESPIIPEDIPDPPVPAGVLAGTVTAPDSWQAHEALLLGFAQALQRKLHETVYAEHKRIIETFDGALVALRKWLESCVTQNEHSTYQLSAAVDALAKSGSAGGVPPYQMTVSALNVDGFPVTFVVSKAQVADVFATLDQLFPWLKENGYRAPKDI